MRLPIALTDIESGTFTGENGDNQADDQIVIRVIFEALGQHDLGTNKALGLELYHAYRTAYLADATYGGYLARVICADTTKATLQLPVTGSGFGLIEYPANSEVWWFGFELRFTVHSEWDVTPC
jgi:hypothetical protein